MGAISSNRATRWLTLAVVALLVASVAGQYVEHLADYDRLAGAKTLIRLVDVDREQNIPTWFSSAALLLCSALLAKTALARRGRDSGYAFHWAVLSALFLVVAIDETTGHHEALSHRLRDALDLTSFLYFSWVVPGAIIAALVALSYTTFLAHLPARTRTQFLAAAVLYLSGVLVVESIGGRYIELNGNDLQYKMITTIEEALEMAGTVVFIHALLAYARLPVDKPEKESARTEAVWTAPSLDSTARPA